MEGLGVASDVCHGERRWHGVWRRETDTEKSVMDGVFPIVTSVFSVLASAFLGLVMNKVSGIERHLADMNGKLFTHLTASNIHEAGFARTTEQINTLLRTVEVAHERIDQVTGGRGERG